MFNLFCKTFICSDGFKLTSFKFLMRLLNLTDFIEVKITSLKLQVESLNLSQFNILTRLIFYSPARQRETI